MKARGLFLSALFMGAVFASCTSENELNDIQIEKKNGQAESFMAINIVASGETNSRGADDGFEVGNADEQAVNDLVLVFFKADGSYYDAKKETFSFTATDGTTSAVESKSDVVVVFNDTEVKPASFIALINTGKEASHFENKTLADIQKEITDYYTTANSKNYFVMSNSVYAKNGAIQVAAPITDNMICSSKDAAMANPAIAYVERVAAKLQATVSQQLNVLGKEVNLNGIDVTLTPAITGMKFVHTNPTSYLLKNIDNVAATWNDATNYRSYWANSYDPGTYNTYSYNEAVAMGDASLTEYANENTSSTPTKLLVTATITAQQNGQPVDIYKYKGYYYTKEGLQAQIASILKGASLKYSLSGAEGDDWAQFITVSRPDNMNIKQWEGVITVSDAITITDDVKAQIAKLDKVRWWKDGKTYFYVPVEHIGADVFGVVRNHWYQLSINSITGLGTPVADPTEPIDPEQIEDETYYVAAQVQILKWKVVTQDVDLK